MRFGRAFFAAAFDARFLPVDFDFDALEERAAMSRKRVTKTVLI